MATATEQPPTMPGQTVSKPHHEYHAEAHAITGELNLPVKQPIVRQALTVLEGRRSDHITDTVQGYALEGLISFKTAHSRVSGNRSMKTDGWVTLSTSVVDHLNVLEVLTADRMVAQVSTEHPYVDGHIPEVTFLGTQFNGLKLSGFPLHLKLNLGLFGKKPANDQPYTKNREFLNTLKSQLTPVAQDDDIAEEVRTPYLKSLALLEQLIKQCDDQDVIDRDPISLTCSLVEKIDIKDIPIPDLKAVGNVLVIPHFGSVALGEVEMGEKVYEPRERPSVYFRLQMLNMRLGCIGDGTASAGTAAANGHHQP